MSDITADFIIDVMDLKCKRHRYAVRFFYVWLYARFGDQPFYLQQVIRDHPLSKRSIQRYMRELLENEMILVHRDHGRREQKMYQLQGA